MDTVPNIDQKLEGMVLADKCAPGPTALTRFPSHREVALARQDTELMNQRIIFDVNPSEPMNGYIFSFYPWQGSKVAVLSSILNI